MTSYRLIITTVLMTAILLLSAAVSAQQEAAKKVTVNPAILQSSEYGGVTKMESSMDSMRDDEIATIENLLKLGASEDEKPKLIFRLAEAFGEKSKHCWFQGMALADEELKYPDNQSKLKEIRETREDWFKKSADFRRRAMEYYKVIMDRYPKYPKIDEVLFFYGHNLMEAQEQTEALKIYRKLIMEYPESSYVPDAYIAFGEYYFNRGELERALEAYKRVAKYQTSRVYGFALYKMGWVYYNMADWDNALDMFSKVIKYSTTSVEENRENKITLKREALKDYVLTYSMLEEIGNVKENFMQVGGAENFTRMIDGLGTLLFDQGKDRQALVVINLIIGEAPDSPKALVFQVKRIEVFNRLSNRKMVVDESGNLVAMFGEVAKKRPAETSDPKEKKAADEWKRTYDEAKQSAELKIRELVTAYHSEAKKTSKDVTYQQALELYKDYLALFPDAKDAYTMRFYYAELLYRLGSFEQAGEEYTRVLELDPEKGKFAKDAAHSAIIAFKNAAKKEKLPKDKSAEVPFPPAVQKWVSSCENYVKWFKNADNVVDVEYEIGEISYKYNHFKEANRIFADIALNYPDSKLAEFSVNLILDSFNLAQNWSELNSWARKFLENPKLARDRVKEDLKRLVAESSFKMIEELEQKGQWSAAAQKYLEFAREYPDSKMADQAMFNAAANYDKAKDSQKSLDTKIAMLLAYPASKLTPVVLWSVAEHYRSLADYLNAAKYFEEYADKYPKEKNAPTALYNAGTYRFGLEQYAESLSDREQYIKNYPKENDAPDVYLSEAVVYEKLKDWKMAAGIYAKFQINYKNDTKELWAMINEGLALLKAQGSGDKEKAQAMKLLQRGVEQFKMMEKKGGKVDQDTLDAVANAAFLLAEAPYRAFEAIKLELPEAIFKKRMVEKQKAMEKVYATYTEIVNYKVAEWAVASLFKIGSSYENFIKSLQDIPVPRELKTSEQRELYRQMIREYTMPIEDKAVSAFQAALAKSQELGIYNAWSVAALERLTKLRPYEYSFGNELRITPDYFGEDVESNGPILGMAGKK